MVWIDMNKGRDVRTDRSLVTYLPLSLTIPRLHSSLHTARRERGGMGNGRGMGSFLCHSLRSLHPERP